MFYRQQITCHIISETPSFEPLKTDILIQTNPDNKYVSETATYLQWHERQKLPPPPQPLVSTRVKWMRGISTYYSDSKNPKPFIYRKIVPKPESEEDREITDLGAETAFTALGARGKRKKRSDPQLWDGLSYLSFPSMMSDDPTGKRRVRMKSECHNFYGNVETKLTFL